MKYVWCRRLVGVSLALLFVGAGLYFTASPQPSTPPVATAMTVHNAYFTTNATLPAVTSYLETVARQEGAAQAFTVLEQATLPRPLDTHRIGHALGDIMYEQEGIHGMRYCDEAVGYACAHSVVINALLRDGPGVFDVINDVCASIGLPGSYDMCFHGFGHGVLAYTEFHVPEAIEMCSLVGTAANDNWEAHECLSGVIMELRTGNHDPELWATNGKPYLDDTNPLALCAADYMPEEYRPMCYVYSTSFIFDHVSPDGPPPPTVYADAMAWCERIDDADERSGCYAGFGMQYLWLVLGGDGRNRNNLTAPQADTLHQWCGEAPTEEGYLACMEYALLTTYQAGSIGYDGALTLCGQSPTPMAADTCYQTLFETANLFFGAGSYQRDLCAAVPPQ